MVEPVKGNSPTSSVFNRKMIETRLLALEEGQSALQAQGHEISQGVGALVQGCESAINQALAEIDDMKIVLGAVCDLIGKDKVQEKVKQFQEEKAAESRAEAAKEVEDALNKGIIAKSDTVGDDSLIIGVRTRPDGSVSAPGRAQTAFKALSDDQKKEVGGKGVGSTFTIPGNPPETFTVSEIYSIVRRAPAK